MSIEPRMQSPFISLIGAVVDEWSAGCVRMTLTVEERHTNPNGVLHGGVITSLMDEAAGGVVAAVRGIDVMVAAPHSTVDMTASFMAALRPGDTLDVEARPARVGRSVAFVEATACKRGTPGPVSRGWFTFVIRQAT